AFKRPLDLVRAAEQRLDDVSERVARAFRVLSKERRTGLAALGARLDALSPVKVLARGYSVTRTGGAVLTRASQAKRGDLLTTTLAEGEVASRVE
ncbi:MAG: exodeoxyribonuclease VII large subunit, partial [Planctomycetota bacterium]